MSRALCLNRRGFESGTWRKRIKGQRIKPLSAQAPVLLNRGSGPNRELNASRQITGFIGRDQTSILLSPI